MRMRLPAIFLKALGVLLLGYACFGKAFAYLGYPPVFVGEFVMAIGLLAVVLTPARRYLLDSTLAVLVLLFCLWGAARTLPFLGEYGAVALRDGAVWGYAAIGLAFAACIRRADAAASVVQRYGRAIPIFLVCAPLAFFSMRAFGQALLQLPWASVPIPPFKAGDVGVHLGGIATFLLLRLGADERGFTGTRLKSAALLAAWVVTALIVVSLNRGAILAVAAALTVVGLLHPRAAGVRLAAGLGVLIMGATMVLLLSTGKVTQTPAEGERPVSVNQMAENFRSILGGSSKSSNLDGTKEWRLEWWREIVAYTVYGREFSGKGFGINLANDDGFQVTEDESLRSPHSVHLTILARAGVPGVLLWTMLNLWFAASMLVGHLQARRAGQVWWAGVHTWLLAYWAALVLNGSVDVFIEGPVGGIWFWAVIGAGNAMLHAARRERVRIAYPRVELRTALRSPQRSLSYRKALVVGAFFAGLTVLGYGNAPFAPFARLEAQEPAQDAHRYYGIAIFPGEDIQARVDAAPAGTSFILKAGLHRLQTIRPREGDAFTGEPGTILSGARALSTFARIGRYWVAGGQTQAGAISGECEDAFPRCDRPEELFIDDQRLLHVSSLGAVGPGKWFFDYAANRIYFWDDPTGRTVETSVATAAFLPTADNVTISKLIVEKYANPAQHGAITADGRTGWVISDNEVRLTHGSGIGIGDAAQVRGNNVHHNGQLGIGGVGDDVVIENNEIAYNNTAHFDPFWEAGGTKFALTRNLIVRGNYVHHNDGPGLWTDIDNIHTLYENNRSEDNAQMGIYHEISYAAVIRNNIVRRNGFGFPDAMWGAGILIAASSDVEVYGNIVEGNADGIGAVQQHRGSGRFGAYEISNLWVHDNYVTMSEGWTGVVEDVDDPSVFTSRNVRFTNNHYQFLVDDHFFQWRDTDLSDDEWRSHGMDVYGSFVRK